MRMEELGFKEINHEPLKRTNKPYKIYAELIDEETQKQFEDVLKAPFVTQASLMPDAHAGYTMPIGAVCSCKDVIVPQFVGFDIGCGMCAYKTDFTKEEIESKAKEIYDQIIKKIPLGFKAHKNHQSFKCDLDATDFAKTVLNSIGLKQLGTLGGGNHFIEIGYGKDNMAWIVIHSGSRGLGHKIATHYMIEAYLQKNNPQDRASKLIEEFENRNKVFKEKNPNAYEKALNKYKNKQLLALNKKLNPDNIKGIWGLDVNSRLGKEYIKDLNFALNFALENRKLMIQRIVEGLNEVFDTTFEFKLDDKSRFINRNHNHAEFDEKRGEWIHRKGATHAKKGMQGVIPGNMRDGSFIVVGKGNNDSLESSSHGAGRVMSRREARNKLSMEDFQNSMIGITGTVDENTIDESPFAYKDIFEVMELQKDLVDVVEHIKVIINVKDSQKRKF